MSSAAWTFSFGLLILILFGWYWATDLGVRKRILGTVLTILMVALCLESVWPLKEKLRLGLDLQGGTSFLIRLMHENESTFDQGQQAQAVEVIRKRIDSLGVSEPVISPQGKDRILVQIPALSADRIEDARQQLKKVAKLEFKLVHPQSDQLVQQINGGAAIIPPGYTIQTAKEMRRGKPTEEKLLVKTKAEMGGEHVTRAHAYFDQKGWGVALAMDSAGGKIFGDLTKQVYEEKSRLAIVLDGEVQSAPGVHEGPIYGGSATITGNFGEQEARNLASALENPLATPVSIEETRSASSTLGADSIKSGIYAGIGGLLLVMVFVMFYYRLAGVVALCGLFVNIILLFGAMSMFNFVLTLPGIAGIILTIGLAVDANVLIYERLREEMAAGKSLSAAVESAYDKAFSVIFDANATTLITAAILFWKATGPVKGFAVTLTVGIIASVFCAMIVTRTLFGWAFQAGLVKRISMLHLISANRKIDFLGRRRLWISLSVGVIVVSVIGFAIRYPNNLGIDFRGGDLLMLKPSQTVSEAQVREALGPLNLKDVVIQKESDRSTKSDYISIRSPLDTAEKIEQHLMTVMPEAGFIQSAKDRVGKLVGGELAQTSLVALGLGVLGILIYVTLRFEFSFAIGAIVALLHDVVITIGLFSIFGRELTLIMVGAILTIAGYSINDTIVVFDRIREGLHAGRKGSIESIMNASINETLSRTLLTSGTTFLSVGALFFFGGPVLRDFAFAILIGIVVGTYSSIFIASPIVLWWTGHKGVNLKAEVKRAEPTPLKA